MVPRPLIRSLLIVAGTRSCAPDASVVPDRQVGLGRLVGRGCHMYNRRVAPFPLTLSVTRARSERPISAMRCVDVMLSKGRSCPSLLEQTSDEVR